MRNLFQQLNKAFENKVRLGIMSVISANGKASFNELKEFLDVTDGNLASHMKKLEELNYIEVFKSFSKRKPVTTYRISEKGIIAFKEHLDALEKIVKQN